MKPYYEQDGIQLFLGDCREVLPALADCSVDSIVTDPPYELGFMGKSWDRSGIAYQVEVWRECLRVLKHGGHLLAFGGSRTYHRLACAIEDAGFEIRDQIQWLYGSGFPKSLDVSKAIDAAAGAEREIVGENPFNARRPNPPVSDRYQQAGWPSSITAPTTDAAKQWDGWGTALKPAHEPIVMARKPLGMPELNVRQVVENAIIRSGLSTHIVWSKSVSVAAKQVTASSSTQTELLTLAGGISASPASLNVTQSTETAIENGSEKRAENGAANTKNERPNFRSDTPNNSSEKSSTPTGAGVSAVGNQRSFSSPLITLMEGEPPTESEPQKFITNSSGLGFLLDTALFAGTAIGDSVSGYVLIRQNCDGSLEWPAELPLVVPARSLTVAENVLKHGTGGLNIDGCRVELQIDENVEHLNARSGGKRGFASEYVGGNDHPLPAGCDLSKGRWPANVIHDGSDEVVSLFPINDANGYRANPSTVDLSDAVIGYSGDAMRGERGHDDTGSAARFFYCAKASKEDRDEGLEDLPIRSAGEVTDRQDGSDGLNSPRAGAGRTNGSRNHHPTVKPTELMRYLVRLVTPPNGTVLDPFGGSGSTAKACALEDFKAILIEKEIEYCEIAMRRAQLRQRRLTFA